MTAPAGRRGDGWISVEKNLAAVERTRDECTRETSRTCHIADVGCSEMTCIAALLADAVRRVTENIEAPKREEAPDA